jgi:HSP20 family molecular chaperone IbpA
MISTNLALPAVLHSSQGKLEEHDVRWFKTDFSRHVLLANEDCELGDRTNPWAFALLKNWLRSAFVPVNRRFSVLQSVLQSCNARLSSYFRTHPELVVEATEDARVKVIRARARQDEDQMRLQQTSVDATGLLLTRPNSFTPAIDIVREKLYSILIDVPGMTAEDIRLSRQNVTTIVKGMRIQPYSELLVQKVLRQERTYGDFTQTFSVPQEYERRWHAVTVHNGVMRIVFKPDTDEESLSIT